MSTKERKMSLGDVEKEFGIPKTTAWNTCKKLGINSADGLGTADVQRLLAEHGIHQAVVPQADPVVVEVGGGLTVLDNPAFGVYDLARFRSSEAEAFADPLAIAQQVTAIAALAQQKMHQDIAQREAKLRETQQALRTVQRQAEDLRLETLKYELEAKMASLAQAAATQELNQELKAFNSPGKPADGAQ